MNRRQAICAFFTLPVAAVLPVHGRRQTVIEGDDVVLEMTQIHGDVIFNGDRAKMQNCTIESEGDGVVMNGLVEEGAVYNCAFYFKGYGVTLTGEPA